MRARPTIDHRCHVCATVFTVQNVFDTPRGRPVGRVPDHCPACDAPLRGPSLIEIGSAKNLLLTLFKVRSYIRDFGDAETFLRDNTVSEAEVDRFMALVETMDYDAWQRSYRDGSLGAEQKALERIRKDAASGELKRRLQDIAEPVRAAHRQEYATHMQTFRQRQGSAD